MQPTPSPGAGGALQLLLLLALLIPAVFFLLTQQNTLKAIKVENRLMNPGLVWLQLIPLFAQIWQFFVVTRIADSIKKEIASRQEGSILGFADSAAVEAAGKRPAFVLGITYSILSTTGFIINFNSLAKSPHPWLSQLALLCLLSGMICWIIYWVRLAGYKRKLKGASL